MKAKILIVEDQADIRRLIRWALEDTGHQLYEAPNGHLAMELARTLQPDLVYLDLMMPGDIDGIEVCRQMRADPRLTQALIVMLTADASQATKTRALATGANFFLAKPFSPAKLLELTEVLIKKRQESAAPDPGP
ncbi:response regulator transcription factor [Paucibacter sp. DJ2R-2]|uniref:response regulator transcription factor n=1 Tax=Paucibacter sp. DJ2R-2 TaxID=2893558 RepID=UPI0021E4595D|nr:response regulator [Paucibacter sp. DJ2R-2]MCV2421079.1 response regulator [Paucibacter sp. DJ4R-1]MCV2439057.1 response regulator [Paucibacter sp. DJ2R-2]